MAHGSDFLPLAIAFLAAAVVAVMLSHRLGLGSIAGYLLAGIALGPWGLGIVGGLDDVRRVAELGVVFLLFVIGLELQPRRLWEMRARLATVGVSQLLLSIIAILAASLAIGIELRAAVVVGMALAVSSTALALQPLMARGGMHSQGAQATFAVLLLQDLAVIPMLTLVPLLGETRAGGGFSWRALGLAVAVIAATLVGGHFLARPVFRYIARSRLREIFTAFSLLLVLGIALGFETAGLSMALGAFLGGMLLAESEYRQEIEAAVEPFKGLLLGLFFVSVGMSVDFGFLLERPLLVMALVVALLVVKGAVLLVVAKLTGLPRGERPLFVVLLAQGGEFAFVMLAVGAKHAAVSPALAQAATLVVTVSMLLTPLMLALHDRLVAPRFANENARPAADAPIEGEVILAGLGRVGQVVARLLNASGYAPTVLDDDPDHVEESRKFGFRVFYGDATRVDLLEAAGAARARFLILALDDPEATTRLAGIARKHFPQLRVIARARDMRHMFELRGLGVEVIERETFHSAVALGEAALAEISSSAERAARAARAFRLHDDEVLAKLHDVHRGAPDSHVTVSNELRDQLARTLAEDAATLARDQSQAG